LLGCFFYGSRSFVGLDSLVGLDWFLLWYSGGHFDGSSYWLLFNFGNAIRGVGVRLGCSGHDGRLVNRQRNEWSGRRFRLRQQKIIFLGYWYFDIWNGYWFGRNEVRLNGFLNNIWSGWLRSFFYWGVSRSGGNQVIV
jgi:hypothetical protein